MSSEPSERAPSERARVWVAEYLDDEFGERPAPKRMALAFDAGYTEGEKKGTAVGYLKALREVKGLRLVTPSGKEWMPSMVASEFAIWLDRRIREGANG